MGKGGDGQGGPCRGLRVLVHDVKHGPVISRKFKADRRANYVGVSMPVGRAAFRRLSFFTQGLFLAPRDGRLKGFLIK